MRTSAHARPDRRWRGQASADSTASCLRRRQLACLCSSNAGIAVIIGSRMALKQGTVAAIIYYSHYCASVRFYFALQSWHHYLAKTSISEGIRRQTARVLLLSCQPSWTSPAARASVVNFRADLTPLAFESFLLFDFVHLFIVNFLQQRSPIE